MNRTIARKIAGIAVIASALVGVGAVAAPAASASADQGASFDCENDALTPPFETSVGTWYDFWYTTDNRASWHQQETYVSNFSVWKYAGGWYQADWSGAPTVVPASYPQNIEAWVRTWTLYNNQWHFQGWAYLGTCQANDY